MNEKNKVKVGMILERDFPPDDRPEKEALSLIEAGYDVHLLCFTWQNRPLQETYKGIKITRFPIKRFVYKKLSPTYLVLPFYKNIWQKHIESFVSENKIDVIHIHDLPMTAIVNKLARKYQCKVVCDQHEFWSNWIVNTKHYNSPLGKVVKFFSRWAAYEKENLKKADLVITVTEPLRACYIKEVGLDNNKVITVPNTPTRSIFKKENTDADVQSKYKENFMIFYAGAMDILRGIDIIINALSTIEKEIPNVKFVMAGSFSKGCNPLQMAREKKVSHLVEFVGWLNVEQLPSYIAASKVCVFTPYATREEINNTIATKIYQYLAMQKPIVTSEAKMMHDFVVKNKIGFAIDTKNENSFSEAILKLFKDYKNQADAISKNSKQLVDNGNIFWDQTVKEMLKAYQKLKTNE